MNWQKIVNELLATGQSQTELSDKVGCPQSTISEISSGKRGKRPSWEVGNKLLELHDALNQETQLAG